MNAHVIDYRIHVRESLHDAHVGDHIELRMRAREQLLCNAHVIDRRLAMQDAAA